MKLSVTQNKVEIVEKSQINQGEYRATECHFDFTKAFEELVKKAIFTDKASGKAYEVLVLDDKCDIPAEILAAKGTCTVGVYAYNIDNDELALRYSPTPVTVTIETGSYKADVENPSDLTTSQAEQLESHINKKLNELDSTIKTVEEKLANGELKGEKGDDGERGEQGEKGQDGKDGADGQDGQDGADGKSAYELAVESGIFSGTQEEWLKSLKGADGTNGADGADGKDGEDGYSPTISCEQIDDTTAKITIQNKDGSSQSVRFGGVWEDAEKENY